MLSPGDGTAKITHARIPDLLTSDHELEAGSMSAAGELYRSYEGELYRSYDAPAKTATLEVTQGQILSQSPTLRGSICM